MHRLLVGDSAQGSQGHTRHMLLQALRQGWELELHDEVMALHEDGAVDAHVHVEHRRRDQPTLEVAIQEAMVEVLEVELVAEAGASGHASSVAEAGR